MTTPGCETGILFASHGSKNEAQLVHKYGSEEIQCIYGDLKPGIVTSNMDGPPAATAVVVEAI